MSEIIQNQSDNDQLYNIEGFSEEEQLEIRAQIDEISGQNRIPVSEELFNITPSKKGGTLPLIINLLGVIAIVASFFLTTRYFQEKEQIMAMEESTYESTEGSVIEELKRQAEEKLNEKQKQISIIQDELSKLDKESASLRENMDSQIKEKELELRYEMETALAEERERLQDQGISTTELEKQLQEFQTARENAFTSEIADFKLESEAVIKTKEEELARAKQINQDYLEQANREKAAIEADTVQREAELTEQFEAEKEALTRETTEATQKLKELSDLQKNEQLIQDQLTGSYNSIIESIKAGNYPEAKIDIADVRNLLDDPNIIKLPSISKRRNFELYFLDSLEKEIQQAGVRTTTDFTSMTRAAEVLLTARQSVEFGVTAEAEGNQYDAKRFYNEALSTLPQIARAVDNLNIIEASDKFERSEEYLLLANKAVDGGQLNEAVKQYRAAAIGTVEDNLNATLATAINGIERILKQESKDLATSTKKDLQKLEASSEKTITELNSELSIQKETIQELEASSEKTITELNSELSTNEESVQGLEANSENTITELNSELSTQKETINKLSSDLEALESNITDLESEKSRLEQLVAEIDTRDEDVTSNTEDLTAEIEDSAAAIEQLNQKAKESAETIASLKTEARKSAFTIETLTKRAALAVNRAEILEEELNDAVNQIVELIN